MIDDGGWGSGAYPTDPAEQRRHDEHRAGIEADVRRLGVCGRDRLFQRFELAELAIAYAEVQDQQRAGARIRNPAGLFVWWLEKNTGRKVVG